MFDVILEPDNSPIDNTNITSFQLFFSTDEMRDFKEQCKKGMIKMFPSTFDKQNVNDFLLQLVQQYNNKNENLNLNECKY
jgi:hypothetical protein